MPMHQREITHPTESPAVTGAVSGIVAALVMAMLATAVSAAQGGALFAPVRLIGATFLANPMDQPILSTVVGVAIHLIMGAGLGVLFGAATSRLRSRPLLVAAAVAYASAVFVLMTYVVLPMVNPLMSANTNPGWFFVYHVAFGLTLAFGILVARARPGREWFADPEQRHSHA